MLESGCAGYPLGYPSRNDIDINTKYTYLVQDRRPDALVCQPNRQNIPGNNPFPIANVVPGQVLHLTWQPDGHLDDAHPSTVEVHWTGVPWTQLYTRSELRPETLLGTMIFATSANCDQPWEPNTWCHGNITIPPGTQSGTYQLIWWWKYDRNPSGEEYSTCFEVSVNGDGSTIQSREVGAKLPTQVVETSPKSKIIQSKKVVEAIVPEQNTLVSAPETASESQVRAGVQQSEPQAKAANRSSQLEDVTMEALPADLSVSSPESEASITAPTAGQSKNPSSVDLIESVSLDTDKTLQTMPDSSTANENNNKNSKQVDDSDSIVSSPVEGTIDAAESNKIPSLPSIEPPMKINVTFPENVPSATNDIVPIASDVQSTTALPASSNKANPNTEAVIPGIRASTGVSTSAPSSLSSSLPSSNNGYGNGYEGYDRTLAGQAPKVVVP
ncbi:hypothetical protein FBU30_002366, partial [Linnemannia zychae]